MKKNKSLFLLFVLLILGSVHALGADNRIVNIVNFVRQNDYRVEQSEQILYETVERQISLLNRYQLPATFLLQYDALIDERYPRLLKERLNRQSEVGAWWELTQPQVEAAGLKWKGDHPWVSTANIAFSIGYTNAERRRLVDVYMEKFRQVFGHYPKSVGSWFIDAHTLAYMQERYHIVASCNCRDQVGTDGYTLWGGYWNQAYYPSKANAYMPAQTADEQIPVPVFRMLGSDPIYQYDTPVETNGQGVFTLEPVYAHSGNDRRWVEAFFDAVAVQPCMAFGYAQAGQENSFTWQAMAEGLELQFPIIARMAANKQLRVETLAQSGAWFRRTFKVTPATAVTALKDTRGGSNKTVWFNSRYYRANLLMNANGNLRLRDLHLFDQRMKSPYLDTPGTESHFTFTTLPVVDGFLWSMPNDSAALRLVRITDNGQGEELRFSSFNVSEQGKTLVVSLRDAKNHLFRFVFGEQGFEVKTEGVDYPWSLDLHAPNSALLPFTHIDSHRLGATHNGFGYALTSRKGFFLKPTPHGGYALRLMPEAQTVGLDCTNRLLRQKNSN